MTPRANEQTLALARNYTVARNAFRMYLICGILMWPLWFVCFYYLKMRGIEHTARSLGASPDWKRRIW